jgi:hypothetical protein
MRSPTPDARQSARDRASRARAGVAAWREMVAGSAITQICNCSSSPCDSALASAPLQMHPFPTGSSGDSGAGSSSDEVSFCGGQHPCGQPAWSAIATLVVAQQLHAPPVLQRYGQARRERIRKTARIWCTLVLAATRCRQAYRTPILLEASIGIATAVWPRWAICRQKQRLAARRRCAHRPGHRARRSMSRLVTDVFASLDRQVTTCLL